MNKITETNQTKEETSTTNIVKLPWVPILGPKLRKEFRKFDIKTVFTSGKNLKSLLCNNKSKLIPNSFPGVYQLTCSCDAVYYGESKKKILTRSIEHQQDSIKGKWESSGATEHCLKCHGQFNWLHPQTIKIESKYYDRKIRESLEIKKSKCSNKNVLNRDEGNVKTNTWTPLFAELNKNETTTKTC